jgi:hypothetical protein
MFIRMSETRRVSEDGFVTRQLAKGETCNVADTAARHAINHGWAVCAEEPVDMETVTNQIVASLKLTQEAL